MGSHGQISSWFVLPRVSEILTVEPNHRESWLVRGVKAGGTDDGVDLMDFSTLSFDTGSIDLQNRL